MSSEDALKRLLAVAVEIERKAIIGFITEHSGVAYVLVAAHDGKDYAVSGISGLPQNAAGLRALVELQARADALVIQSITTIDLPAVEQTRALETIHGLAERRAVELMNASNPRVIAPEPATRGQEQRGDKEV